MNVVFHEVFSNERGLKCVVSSEVVSNLVICLLFLFIYYHTANDGRPRSEEVIGNAKVNIKRHTYKTIQTENIVDGEVTLKGWVL